MRAYLSLFFGVLLLAPAHTWAVSVESTSSNALTSVSSLTVSHTITAANKLIVTVALGCDDSGGNKNVTGVTFNGDALSQVAEVDDPAWTSVEIWELHNPDVTTADVVVTLAGSCAQVAAGATGFISAHATLGTPNTAQTTSANPSVTVVDSASGDIVVSVLSTDAGPDGTTTPGGTQLWETEDLDADIDINAQRQTASGASTVASWTSPSSNWSAAGVAVRDVGGGGGGTPGRLLLLGVGQ